MRIVGHVAHPYLKITIFQLDQKYTLKLEDRFFEHSYKFMSEELPDGVNSIHKIVNDDFLNNTMEFFKQMMGNRIEGIKSMLQEKE